MSREIENRAFIAVKEIIIEGGLETVIETGGIDIKLRYANVGKTPAKNVRSRAKLTFLPAVHDREQFSGRVREQAHAVVSPGETFPGKVSLNYKAEWAAKGVAEGKRLHVCGVIHYEDVFNKPRETSAL